MLIVRWRPKYVYKNNSVWNERTMCAKNLYRPSLKGIDYGYGIPRAFFLWRCLLFSGVSMEPLFVVSPKMTTADFVCHSLCFLITKQRRPDWLVIADRVCIHYFTSRQLLTYWPFPSDMTYTWWSNVSATEIHIFKTPSIRLFDCAVCVQPILPIFDLFYKTISGNAEQFTLRQPYQLKVSHYRRPHTSLFQNNWLAAMPLMPNYFSSSLLLLRL